MGMSQRFAMVLGLGLCLSVAAFAQVRRDGRWEVRMDLSMPGMPVGMPGTTTIECITPKDAEDPQNATPHGRGGPSPRDCTISDYKVVGNKVSWSMKCTGRDAMSGTGELVYTGDTYTGVVKMTGRETMTLKYRGKRLGDCTQ
jgi:hypothetical protein